MSPLDVEPQAAGSAPDGDDETFEVGLDLTFAELAVLPVLRDPDPDLRHLGSIGVDPVSAGSDVARAGLASLAVRGLVATADDSISVMPAIEMITGLLVEPTWCTVIEIDDDERTVLTVFESDRAVLHRRMSLVIHRFSPLDPAADALTVLERLVASIGETGGGRLTVRSVVADGAHTERAPIELRIEPGVLDAADVVRPVRDQRERPT